MIGSFIFIIFQFINKNRVLTKKLGENEKYYRELAIKYAAVETLNQNLGNQIQEEIVNNSESLIQKSRQAAIGEMITRMEHPISQSLNSLSLLIQDVREAHEFREIDDHYVDSFTRESMFQIKQISRMINDLGKLYKQNE
jgi:phosphoglycerate-specific signal transduction histidine kinase